jgi:ribosomal protein S18 acetylase RimI-like enzyme
VKHDRRMMKRISLFKRIIVFSILLLTVAGGYYFLKPTVRIYDYNEQRDTSFILDIFQKDWYWLVAEGSDFSPEFMLHYQMSPEGPDIGKEIIKVMYKGNDPVGFVTYRKKKFSIGDIHFLAVKEEFRSKGYGFSLLKYAIKDLLSRGCRMITLATRTNNYSGQKIYKKAGFKETQRTDGFVYFEYQEP